MRPAADCKEAGLLAVLLLAFAILSFVSIAKFPVHIDEPGYIDPAASFVQGQGFTSGAWYAQTHDEIWAGNVPLHQFALIAWFKIFGFGLTAARAINILYIVVAAALLWIALKQGTLLRSPVWRVSAILFLLLSFGSAQMMVMGRPDAITFLLAALGFFALRLPNALARRTLLILVGALAPWAGLQLAAALAFSGVLVLLFWRRYFPELLAVAVGGFLGTATLLGWYYSMGTLDAFRESIGYHTAARGTDRSYSFFTLSHRAGALRDPSFLLLIAAFGLAFAGCIFSPQSRRRAKEFFPALALLLGIPAWMIAIGVFPSYYSWFAVLPASLALFSLLESQIVQHRLMRGIIFSFLALAALLGVPRVFAAGWLHAADDVNANSDHFVLQALRPDDVAIVEKQAYYPAKTTTSRVFYIQWYMDTISDADKASLSVAIMDPKTFERVSPYFGGKWNATGETLRLPQRNLMSLPGSKWYQANPTITLSVYRRSDTGHP